MKTAAAAMSECDSLRESLHSVVRVTTKHEAAAILYQLDEISRGICNVIDAAELCRSVHAEEDWREAADRAFGLLSDYIAQLNADTRLYQALLCVTSQTSLFNELTTEEQRFAYLLQSEFERDGIHLPDAQREQVRQI